MITLLRFNGLVCLALLSTNLSHAEKRPQLSGADYDRAAKVLDANLKGALKNALPDPHWSPGRKQFWYRREAKAGFDYVLVDAEKGTKHPLFDHAKIADAIRALLPEAAIAPENLNLASLDSKGEQRIGHLTVAPDKKITCDLDAPGCQLAPEEKTRPNESKSPDGNRAVSARENNLWLRDLATGEEKQLTTDGEAYFAYGKVPDSSLYAVVTMRAKAPAPPSNVTWSPDSQWLIVSRLDERNLELYPYVEWVPQDGSFRPITYQLHLALLGDKGTPPPQEVLVIDLKSGAKHKVALPEDWRLTRANVAWSGDSRHCFALAETFGAKKVRLLEVDCETGATRAILEETSETSVWLNEFAYSPQNVRVLGGGTEVIWFSERDGWGHLYLYDVKTGSLRRQITTGPWLVRDIIAVDEKERKIYFTASGREKGWDPYLRALYCTSLDKDGLILLTPEEADHEIIPAGPLSIFALDDLHDGGIGASTFVDTASTVRSAPVTNLRALEDGQVIAKLEDADATAIFAAGWRAPERLGVKAADGKTELRAVIYYPPGYDKSRKYPVIDAFYGGPQMANAPTTFAEAASAFNPISRASLAELGFIVLTIDGRGTSGRSKEFHDASYGHFADPEIEDHVSVIKELAARLGTFDLDRVGVYGHSFGGYTSARAILSHPEFYKVAVSSAGPHDFQGFYDGLENLFGIPDYGDGNRFRPSPAMAPLNYQPLDNRPLALRLRGRLMLIYGDMDENALPAVTLQLADALITANKTFDLVYLPNRTHAFFRSDPYYTRRLWDYFVEHLLGATPPENYELKFHPAANP